MKKFFKKANRGLLLSAIVLLVVIIYIVADYVSFNSQKSTIRDVVENYYKDIYSLNTLKGGKSDETCKKTKDVIDKYWSDADSSLSWATYKNQLMSDAVNMFDKTDTSTVFDNSAAEYNIQELKISKSGPSYALITISYSASITGKSNSNAITVAGMRTLYDAEDEDDESSNDENINDNENSADNKVESKEGTLNYSSKDAYIELHKESGKWKICAIDAYDSTSDFSYSDGK